MQKKILDFKFLYTADAILAKKRKSKIYSVLDSIPIEVNSVSQKECKIVGMHINTVTEHNIIQPYISYNGDIYTAFRDGSLTKKSVDDDVFSSFMDAMKSIKHGSTLDKKDFFQQVGIDINHMPNKILFPEFDNLEYNDVINGDDIKKIISDDRDYVIKKLNQKVSENFLIVDGHLFVRTRGPSMYPNAINGFNVLQSWSYGDFLNLHKTSHHALDISVNMVDFFRNEQNPINGMDDEDLLGVIITDMEPFERVNRDMYAKYIYDGLFTHVNTRHTPEPEEKLKQFFEDSSNGEMLKKLMGLYQEQEPESDERFDIVMQILSIMEKDPLARRHPLFSNILTEMNKYDWKTRYEEIRNKSPDKKSNFITYNGCMHLDMTIKAEPDMRMK